MELILSAVRRLRVSPASRSFRLVAILCLVALSCACRQDTVSAPPAESALSPSSQSPDPSGGRPQPKLPTTKLYIGTNEITAELATTEKQIRTGMMWRTNMAEMEGMLFVFGGPTEVAFYMRNTLIPLSCAYIDPDGVILEVHEMKPRDETTIPSASDRVQYVLEMNKGWFDRHNVKPGMNVATAHGTLRETFFRRR